MARHTDETKIERVMQAAVELVNKQGYSSTTIMQIAREAGVSSGYLYRHYPGKEELIQAIYDKTVGELDDYIDYMIKNNDKVRDIMAGFISYIFKRANNEPELVKFICLMLYEQTFNIPAKRSKKTSAQCQQLLKKGNISGEIKKGITPEDIYITFFSIPIKLIESRIKPSNKKNQFSKVDVEKITCMCMNAVR